MDQRLTLPALLALALSMTPSLAAAQAAPPQPQTYCYPGQPCVLVVAQPMAPTPPPPQQVVAPAAAPGGYMAPARPMVEVTHRRLRKGLLIPGAIMLGVGWLLNWTLAGLVEPSSSEREEYRGWSFIPIVGPFVDLSYLDDDHGMYMFHVLFGVLQAGGFLMALLGTVLAEETVSMEYALGGDDGPTMAVLPYADTSGAGLAVRVAGF